MPPEKSKTKRGPLHGWLGSFKSDFLVTRRWFRDVGASFGAVFYKFLTKAPWRIKRLVGHLWVGVLGAFTWLFIDSVRSLRRNPPETVPTPKQAAGVPGNGASTGGLKNWLRGGLLSLAAWLGRLVTKTVDLFSLGELVDFLTMVFKVNTRGLTQVEIEEARKVFGDSISYWRIRLDEWSLLAHLGRWMAERRFGAAHDHMAVTVFSTIHFSRRINPQPGNSDMGWLIHELAHAAQMEHVGSQFMGEAVYDQGVAGYDYGGPKALPGRDLKDFNREQQGDIAKHYYFSLYDKLDLTEAEKKEYKRLVKQLRNGQF